MQSKSVITFIRRTNMAEIIIQLDGGLVQDVLICGTGKITDAIVVDDDVEMCTDNLIKIKLDKNRTYTASVHMDGVHKLLKGSDVDKMVAAYLKKKRRKYA
jgi:hypothetical protein